MKIRLVGHPGKVVQRGGTIITVMEYRDAPPLPDSMPDWPDALVAYTVYVDERQWRKVAGQAGALPGVLVIDGYCFYDADLHGLAVLAQSVAAKTINPE